MREATANPRINLWLLARHDGQGAFMRKFILAAILAAAPIMAQARDVPSIVVGSPTSYSTGQAGTTTYKVSLQAGKFYSLGSYLDIYGGYVDTYLKNASGSALAYSYTYNDELEAKGSSFRAPYSGDYFVTVTGSKYSSYPYFQVDGQVYVNVDCDTTVKTTCTIPVGTTRPNPVFDYRGDAEWFQTTLKAKKSYRVALSGDAVATPGCVALQVLDAKGKVIPPTSATILPDNSLAVTFKAKVNGAAFIAPSYSCAQGPVRFSLSLTGG